jgi:hypothetical protein
MEPKNYKGDPGKDSIGDTLGTIGNRKPRDVPPINHTLTFPHTHGSFSEGGETMDFDDFDWQDGVIYGSFADYMVDQEEEDEKRRKKLEQDPDYDSMDDLEEDVENDEDPAP